MAGALAMLPTVFFGWQAFISVTHDEAGHAAIPKMYLSTLRALRFADSMDSF